MKTSKWLCLWLALAAGTAACAQVQKTAAKIDPVLSNLCGLALPLVGANPAVGVYVTAACTAEGLVKLAADPHSAEWLQNLYNELKK